MHKNVYFFVNFEDTAWELNSVTELSACINQRIKVEKENHI